MNDTYYIQPLADNDFTELLIRHMIHDPTVYAKTKQLKVTGEDMVLDDTFGNPLYKELVNIINSVGAVPLSAASIFNGLKVRFETGILPNEIREDTGALLEYFYDESRPLEDPSFFDGKISPFLKKRRAAKIIAKHKDDLAVLTSELNKLQFDLNGDDENSRARIITPFSKIVFKTKTSMIGTGISKLDEKIDGLMLGEYAIIVGFSGGGKTAVGSNIVGQSAELGRRSMYISCEEHEEDISQRFYSRVFRIPYRQLRHGQANLELECKFNEETVAKKRQLLSDNLRLVGLKGVGEINADFLYETILRNYEATGFIPEIVMLDQLQFISSLNTRKGSQQWQDEQLVAAELDNLSHRPIGGKNFTLWVQHQAKGKTKKHFTRDDIDGFKGIIHKTDLTMGVGRADAKSDEINLFSLKVRHCPDFSLTLKTEFEYMNVTSTEVRDTMPATDNGSGMMTQVNQAPIPQAH